MQRYIDCLIIIGLVLLAPTGWAQSGYVEVRVSGQQGVDGTPWQLVERWRPRFNTEINERIALFTELEISFQQGRRLSEEIRQIIEASDFGPLLSDAGIAWPEPANDVLGIDGVDDYLNVARVYVDLYQPDFDLRLGRQAIHWGSAAFLNPTDPFPELLIAEPWRPRRGMNAARMLMPIGEVSDLTTVVGTNDSWTTIRAASRLRTTLALADLSVVAAYRGDDDDGFVGCDLRGTYGVGYWLEAALWSGDWNTFDAAIGFDYSIDSVLEGVTFMVQYFYNGRGASETAEIGLESLDLESSLGFEQSNNPEEDSVFGPILSGRHYAMSAVNVSVSLDAFLGVAGLMNLKDGTGFVVPTLSYRPTDWSEASLTVEIPFALDRGGGEFYPSDESLVYSRSLDEGSDALQVDFSGLRPDATATVWYRVSY